MWPRLPREPAWSLPHLVATAAALAAISCTTTAAQVHEASPPEETAAAAAPASGSARPIANEPAVLVTAQRRKERLINVPISLSAVSGTELTAVGVRSTGDLSLIVPGLVTPNIGLSFTPAIRSVTSLATSPGNETNVTLNLDDVYVGASTAGLFEFKDVERIEVLRRRGQPVSRTHAAEMRLPLAVALEQDP